MPGHASMTWCLWEGKQSHRAPACCSPHPACRVGIQGHASWPEIAELMLLKQQPGLASVVLSDRQAPFLLTNGAVCGSGGRVGMLLTGRSLIRSSLPPNWVSRCPWARHLTLTAPDELAVALHGWHRIDVWMGTWKGECLSLCRCFPTHIYIFFTFLIYWSVRLASV